MTPLGFRIALLAFLTMVQLQASESQTPAVSLIPYKQVGDQKSLLHIIEPPAGTPKPYPAVLLLHSGGWVNGSPEKYYFIAERLAQMGYLVAVAQYRRYNPKAQPPVSVSDAVADSQDAMRYLHNHAQALGIDAERIVACGGSAGGHLAAGLALFADANRDDAPDAYRPAALILFNPVIDTSAEGYGQEKLGTDWESLSPLHQLKPGLPPTLIFHGTGDRTTPFVGAEKFTAQATAQGDDCTLVVGTGDHGYYQKQPIFDETMDAVRRFSLEHGLLPTQSSQP